MAPFWKIRTPGACITNNTVYMFISFTAAVTWQGKEARLTIHYENGFTLTNAANHSDSGNESNKGDVHWYYPYEKLRYSSDDSKRLLWLDFGAGEGEFVSIEREEKLQILR